MHRSRDVSDILDRVSRWLGDVASHIDYTDFKLLYKNQIVSNSMSLLEAGIVEDAKVYIQLDEPM